jgi:poly(3-hydroxybutyrate) depolymerase
MLAGSANLNWRKVMKSIKRILLVTLVVFGFTVSNVDAQNVFKTTSKTVIGYYEYVPPDYNSNSNKYPVMIFLHGIGERCSNTTSVSSLSSQIYEVAKLGPPMQVKNGYKFPFILISPQLKEGVGNWPTAYIKEVIDHVKNYLRIDEKRIYLTGLSLGGGATWTAAQDMPYLFAGIAPVCGGYNSTSKAAGIGNEDIAVWGFHGLKDNVVSYGVTTRMINAINYYHPSPTAKVSLYANTYHDAWKYAYRTDHTMHNPNMYEWIVGYRNTRARNSNVPTASAQSDKTIYLTSGSKTTLTGSGTDTESAVTYYWTKIGGPGGAGISGQTTRTVTVSGLVRGTYLYRMTVKDNVGNTDSDYVKLFVK